MVLTTYAASLPTPRESRRHGVEEEEADEIQAWLAFDDTPTVVRLSLVFLEDGEIDPREVGTETGTPDDVADVESALVLKHREAVSNTNDAGDALDPGSGEILGLDPDQRGSVGEEPPSPRRLRAWRSTRRPNGSVLCRHDIPPAVGSSPPGGGTI